MAPPTPLSSPLSHSVRVHRLFFNRIYITVAGKHYFRAHIPLCAIKHNSIRFHHLWSLCRMRWDYNIISIPTNPALVIIAITTATKLVLYYCLAKLFREQNNSSGNRIFYVYLLELLFVLIIFPPNRFYVSIRIWLTYAISILYHIFLYVYVPGCFVSFLHVSYVI